MTEERAASAEITYRGIFILVISYTPHLKVKMSSHTLVVSAS